MVRSRRRLSRRSGDAMAAYSASSTSRSRAPCRAPSALVCALGGAVTNAGSVIQTRRLTTTETTSSIVFYFSFICAIAGLATLPFGWIMPMPSQLAALIGLGIFGGLAHILLTESYRHAPASMVAPFDYSAMVWAFLLGYVLVGGSADALRLCRFKHRRRRRFVCDLSRAPAGAAPRARSRGAADGCVRGA